MPPLDWSIVQSAILFLILPSFGIAVAIMALSAAITRLERRHDTAATIALIAALAVGNSLNNLVPFFEFETGWRGLFWATTVAWLVERIIAYQDWRRSHPWFTFTANVILAAVLSMWLMEWDPKHPQYWLYGLLTLTILSNWAAMGFLSERPGSHLLPLFVALVWGGSSAVVLILSHSARFADLVILLSCCVAGVGIVVAITRQRPQVIYSGPAVFIPALMLAAAFNTYSNVPSASFVIIAVTPAIWGMFLFKPVTKWFEMHPKTSMSAALLPGLIAVGLAVRAEM